MIFQQQHNLLRHRQKYRGTMSGPFGKALARARTAQATSNVAVKQQEPLNPGPALSTVPSADGTRSAPKKLWRNVHVNKLSERYQATKWMMDTVAEDGPKHLISKCVKNFPQIFPGNMKANLGKESRWWG